MSISRKNLVPNEEGTLHICWRCHNRESYFRPNEVKDLYLRALNSRLEKKEARYHGKVKVHCFSVMDNHFHMILSYKEGFIHMSNFMRDVQSIFGMAYNKINQRSGKVSNSRPTTPVIQDDRQMMITHMYIEANPVRAGKYKSQNQLLNDQHNTFGLFAYGKRRKGQENIEMPLWYIELGETPTARQRAYRKIFKKYVGSLFEKLKFGLHFLSKFIGDDDWQKAQMAKLKNRLSGALRPPLQASGSGGAMPMSSG